jgi:hypothetical protein
MYLQCGKENHTVQYHTNLRALVKVLSDGGRGGAKVSLDSNKLYGVGGERMQKGEPSAVNPPTVHLHPSHSQPFFVLPPKKRYSLSSASGITTEKRSKRKPTET